MGNGECEDGACSCFAGFSGRDCSVESCCSGHGSCLDPDACQCDPGWGGDECSQEFVCPNSTDVAPCSGHGACNSGVCDCDPGFFGAGCQTEPCGGVDCGEHGSCNPFAKQCDCDLGFVGPDCSEQLQPCPNDCNHHGFCFNGHCICGNGWSGDDCAETFFQPGQSFEEMLKSTRDALQGQDVSEERMNEVVLDYMHGSK